MVLPKATKSLGVAFTKSGLGYAVRAPITETLSTDTLSRVRFPPRTPTLTFLFPRIPPPDFALLMISFLSLLRLALLSHDRRPCGWSTVVNAVGVAGLPNA
jgi:hypothetical protein